MAETSDSDPVVESRLECAGGARDDESAAATPSSTPAKKPPAKCQACTTCRQKKVRCDGGKPACSACLRSGADCLYVPSRRRGRPARASRGYERPYANPLPILPRQPRSATGTAVSGASASRLHGDPPAPAPNRVLPTLPHLQPSQAGQGFMPPPQPTAQDRRASLTGPLPPILPVQPPPAHSAPHPHQHQHQHQKQPSSDSLHQRLQGGGQQSIAPLGSILAAALFPGSPNSTSEDDGGHSCHHSSGSESPLPLNVRPPPFLVPAGERGGHQTMTQATPLVIPRPSQLLSAPGNSHGAHISSDSGSGPGNHSSYMDPNIVEFFHYFNALFPVVHWPSFREAYDDGTVPNYLILAIRALSKRYSKQPSVVLSGQLYAAGQDLAAIATSLAEVATREDPNTYLIQTWIILSMFEFGMGRIKQAADRRELAVRLAYQLELSYIEARASQRRARSLIVAENCRRVWWTLFYADRYFSLVSSDPGIGPAIDESMYRVGFPRAMREATPPPPTLQRPAATTSGSGEGGSLSADGEFSRYDDHDVILWFQSAIPLSLIMGHLANQCRSAEQLFSNGLAERSTEALWEDGAWLAALTEFVKYFLVIDAEIAQWRQQLNAANAMSRSPADSPDAAASTNVSPEARRRTSANTNTTRHGTRDVTLFHRELQYHALVVIHQCLALYSYEKLRQSLSALASACTSLLWLESTAAQAWKKVVRSADAIRTKTQARAADLANVRTSQSGTTSNGTAPEPEWELCAPHMPFILYLSAKVHICQYHWQKIALARTRMEAHGSRLPSVPGSHSLSHLQSSSLDHQLTPSFVQPFSRPPSDAGTPAPAQDNWSGGNAGARSDSRSISQGSAALGQINGIHTPSMLDESRSARDLAGTPVMTTSAAAALAAAQAAAQSTSSKHTTPHRSRGSSAANDRKQQQQRPPPPLSASTVSSSNTVEMMDTTPDITLEQLGAHMSVDDIDDSDVAAAAATAVGAEAIGIKLTRRVAQSQERLECLLRLLATSQEYWADHDYVRLLRDMLDWPDEWTTSMHMLERLLLELRLD